MPETGKVQHPIAFCNIHGVFPATAVALGKGARITIVNCRANCPVCGASSEIIPGHYQARADHLNLLIDQSISPSAIAALRSLAVAASTGKITAEQAKAEAEKIHPKAGKLFDVQNWSDQAKATLYAAIIAAAGAITAARIATNSGSPSKTPPSVEQVLEERKDNLLSTSSLKPIGQIPIPRPRPKLIPESR